MIPGAYHNIPALVHGITLSQISAPMDIHSFIHNGYSERGDLKNFIG
jgi:hypothetical protein